MKAIGPGSPIITCMAVSGGKGREYWVRGAITAISALRGIRRLYCVIRQKMKSGERKFTSGVNVTPRGEMSNNFN